MRLFVPVFCLLLATACDEKSPLGPTVAVNERFTLAAGDAAVIEDTDLRLQFVQVTGDSRCPADALCIQGGDAVVHVRVFDSDRSPVNYELHTGDSSRGSAVHRAFRIELLELQPYPFSSRTIEPGDYRATLNVSRM